MNWLTKLLGLAGRLIGIKPGPDVKPLAPRMPRKAIGKCVHCGYPKPDGERECAYCKFWFGDGKGD